MYLSRLSWSGKVLCMIGVVIIFFVVLIVLLLWPQQAKVRTVKQPTAQVVPDPSAVPPTPTITAPTPVSPSTHVTLKSFVGTWYTNAGTFTVTANGSALLALRNYQTCSAQVKPPCDSVKDGKMVDGIIENMMLTSVKGNEAYGTVIDSTMGDKGKSVEVTLNTNDTVSINLGNELLCGPSAPSGYCGV